jgi:dihydrofolate synthase/folylpolyglutamate synthase
MSYATAIEQLHSIAPELYTNPGQPRRKFSLDEIGTLLGALGNPHRRVRSVLIAGTNGKGSTAATLASILTASGCASASIHRRIWCACNERIRIGEAEIADEALASSTFARVHRGRARSCWQDGQPAADRPVFLRF